MRGGGIYESSSVVSNLLWSESLRHITCIQKSLLVQSCIEGSICMYNAEGAEVSETKSCSHLLLSDT